MNKPVIFSAIVIAWMATPAAAAPICDAGNGGLSLPAGFCALVVADNLGPARNAVTAANGDLYVTLQEGPNQTGGVVALRDADNDGKFEIIEKFGAGAGTGMPPSSMPAERPIPSSRRVCPRARSARPSASFPAAP